ncbi:hypothetical protein ABZR88_02355 [Mucilaginibacter yixingensis]|nr:hypothetical protein [Mucilaginibacter yixingensis]
MAFSCPSHTPTKCHNHNGTTVQAQDTLSPVDGDDDGGDNGHVPPGFTSAPGN